MNIVFLMDPLSTINPKKDTTYLLMLGAQKKGHQVFYMSKGGMTRLEEKRYFMSHRLFHRKITNSLSLFNRNLF